MELEHLKIETRLIKKCKLEHVSVPRSCHKLLSGTKNTMSQKRTVCHRFFFVTSCLEIVTKKACLFAIQILDRKHALLKKQTCFRFLQQEASVSIWLSFPRMVNNGGTGASSTAKSLLEKLHEAEAGRRHGRRRTRSCAVMSTVSLLPAMMIPGGILLLAT